MRKSLRRWLFQRRQPKLAPLVTRTTWGDFAHRMRRAIAIDIAVELGEITRRELRERQKTRPLASVDYNAHTIAEHARRSYAEDTIADNHIDQYATEPMLVEVW